MSTKNISRTIIEGGRAKRNKEDRWDSNQHHRAQNRQFSYNARNLIDADELGVTPERKHVMKGFDDKLAVVYRWLHSYVGKPWNEAYSELKRRFDLRTTAGRHIIVDHVLGSAVSYHNAVHDYPRSSRFYVDEDGILQIGRERRWRSQRGIPNKVINKWADGRRVMDYGVSLFWMVPKKFEWVDCGGINYGKWWSGLCHRNHRDAVNLVQVDTKTVLAFEKSTLPQKVIDGVTVYYREQHIKQCRRGCEPFQQGDRLSAKDMEMWFKLSESDRQYLLWVVSKEEQKKLPYKTSKRWSDLTRGRF
jgi:hypothetical protein